MWFGRDGSPVEEEAARPDGLKETPRPRRGLQGEIRRLRLYSGPVGGEKRVATSVREKVGNPLYKQPWNQKTLRKPLGGDRLKNPDSKVGTGDAQSNCC